MIGEVLRDTRKKSGMTQEELAFKAGIHRTYISFLERDIKSPTVEVLFKICKALDISASEFIARVEENVGDRG